MSHRVVITGIGLTSPIGHSLDEVSTALQEGRHGISTQPGWDKVEQLQTPLGGRDQGHGLQAVAPQEDPQHGQGLAAVHLRDRARDRGRPGDRGGADLGHRRAGLWLDPRLEQRPGDLRDLAVPQLQPQGPALELLPQVHEPHVRGQPGAVLWDPRPGDHHLLSVCERQPGDRLRL